MKKNKNKKTKKNYTKFIIMTPTDNSYTRKKGTMTQHEEQRCCTRGPTTAWRPRLPLQECRNPPSLPVVVQSSPPFPPKKEKSRFPCPTDPVPEAETDFTELWRAVSMAKAK